MQIDFTVQVAVAKESRTFHISKYFVQIVFTVNKKNRLLGGFCVVAGSGFEPDSSFQAYSSSTAYHLIKQIRTCRGREPYRQSVESKTLLVLKRLI